MSDAVAQATLKLSEPVSELNGVGDKLTLALAAKGVNTIRDLLFYFPRKYQDFSQISQIKNLRPGQVSIRAKITQISSRRARRGLSITEAIARDESGSVRVVWFNQPYRKASLKSEAEYYLSGTFKLSGHNLSLLNPACELAGDITLSSGRIVPTYSESKTLSSWMLRKAIAQALPYANQIKDFLPSYIISDSKLDSLPKAITQIHFPDSNSELENARKLFQFYELFPQLLANELNNRERQKQAAVVVKFKPELARSFVAKLPFKLTDDQRKAIWQIYQDMERQLPMNRLVEGDVGSGKTVVAVMSALMAMDQGYKV
ncbi:MAG: OB-fold nucleic acid binding domain-containing protein, partial [Candidatus Saccharimonadales bacterium]